MRHLKIRLILLSFLQFAVWGAYLVSQGRYLSGVGFGDRIGLFYAVQGIVSMFMPALMGIVADRYVPAQRLLGICHALAGTAMAAAGIYGVMTGAEVEFGVLFSLFALSILFFMPTIALSNSVAYTVLERAGMDPVKEFPPIRVWGTVGFICSMLFVDVAGFRGQSMQTTSAQYVVSGILSLALAVYTLTLPGCPVSNAGNRKSIADAMGLRAFALFRQRRMAVFFIFSMLLGVALQITNGFASPFLADFGHLPEYENSFGVAHSNVLISVSQVSEALCFLLIPFFLKKYGIKTVMLIAMTAWTLRFALFAVGNPGNGVWLFILSMAVYGVAFDFFNISGSLFVNQTTDKSMRASAQGLFMLMTNGIGAAAGTLGAQAVVNALVNVHKSPVQGASTDWYAVMSGWSVCWWIFAAYALFTAVLFAVFFRYGRAEKH
ncbi:MAG TPA: MFS transporter [Candidatus Coprenecus stercoravium]|uniref:MFS transporter n=1 Tax=Candidatus Coprenecus stercoravium TaxID=2840735 RepID=A0A9D2KA06_9BACT|nr:MFS transporter [Candidatus Coprenecus stercoravium]